MIRRQCMLVVGVLSGVKARCTDDCSVAGAQGWNINK